MKPRQKSMLLYSCFSFLYMTLQCMCELYATYTSPILGLIMHCEVLQILVKSLYEEYVRTDYGNRVEIQIKLSKLISATIRILQLLPSFPAG